MGSRMRPFRRDHRGLAEIVGTLMLVVIVVAAATAFSFFVAAYQKQLQANETTNHNRQLENLKVISLAVTTCSLTLGTCVDSCSGATSDCFAELSFTVASLDVNNIELTSLFLNHDPIVNFSVQLASSIVSPCYNASNLQNSTYGVGTCLPASLPAFGTVTLNFDLDAQFCKSGGESPCEDPGLFSLWAPTGSLTPTTVITLQALTGLGNEFTESFTPPDAIASVFYVPSGSTSVPVFDGLDSYQPPSSNNASILAYDWTISDPNAATDCVGPGWTATAPSVCSGAGPEIEGPTFSSPGSYEVTLEVINSDGLAGFASISYLQQ